MLKQVLSNYFLSGANAAKQEEFYTACRTGNLAKIKELALAIDINRGNPKNFCLTGLHLACNHGNREVVRYLLAQPKINTNRGDQWGHTSLYFACEQGREDIVKLLLKDKRVDVNKEKGNKQTPLWIACRKGREDVIRMLLQDHRVNVNQMDCYGETPLWIACFFGREEVVKMFLACGKPLDMAKGEWSGKEYSLAEIARLDPRKTGKGEATALLIEEYLKNPKAVGVKLRKELEWTTHPAELFALGTFLCDGVLRLKESKEYSPQGRFFKILEQLHLDVQVVLINRSQGLADNYIPRFDRDFAFACLAQTLQD